MTEEWNDIPGFEGPCEASNSRQIRSIRKNKILKPVIYRSGRIIKYFRVNLSVKNKRYELPIHRLILKTFIGEPPTNQPFACHMDNNPLNNNLNNLIWGSPKENTSHRKIHGTYFFGEKIKTDCFKNGDSKRNKNSIRGRAKR